MGGLSAIVLTSTGADLGIEAQETKKTLAIRISFFIKLFWICKNY